MNITSLFSGFEWGVAWRYLRARRQHFQAKWAPLRVKEMRQGREGGAS